MASGSSVPEMRMRVYAGHSATMPEAHTAVTRGAVAPRTARTTAAALATTTAVAAPTSSATPSMSRSEIRDADTDRDTER